MKILGFLFLLIINFSLFASPIPDFPFVTVTGDSTRKVTPDNAVVRLQVVVFEKESSKGQVVLKQTIQQILEIFESNLVNPNSITTYEMNKRAKRARENNGYNELEILGYEFTQSFEIKLKNLENYSVITTELAKVNNVERVESQFDVSNRENIEVELISEAGKKAKLKAKQMAAGLGVKIDSVFAINDSGSYQSFFATFGLQTENQVSMMRSGSPINSLFIPEFIEISKSINVVYKLDD